MMYEHKKNSLTNISDKDLFLYWIYNITDKAVYP